MTTKIASGKMLAVTPVALAFLEAIERVDEDRYAVVLYALDKEPPRKGPYYDLYDVIAAADLADADYEAALCDLMASGRAIPIAYGLLNDVDPAPCLIRGTIIPPDDSEPVAIGKVLAHLYGLPSASRNGTPPVGEAG